MLFFFDIDDGRRLVVDDLGTELPDLQAARNEAIGSLPGIARDVLPNGDTHIVRATVRDAAGMEVFRATLSLSAEWLDPSVQSVPPPGGPEAVAGTALRRSSRSPPPPPEPN